jgi:hypothetical protein
MCERIIEHKHWPRKSLEGIDKQHIAIVGYSHYGDLKKDSSTFTHWALGAFMKGKEVGDQFFPAIQSYFGFDGHPEFWNYVHFFNFVPQCFAREKKYATADAATKKKAQDRFLRILREETPDKVFVFSRKAWNQCPSTVEEEDNRPCTPLKANPSDNWGTYRLDGHEVRVCGFRHPLYARHADVKRSVQEFLKMK